MGAITLFGNLMDYHGALQRYSLQIKGRYIEVLISIFHRPMDLVPSFLFLPLVLWQSDREGE